MTLPRLSVHIPSSLPSSTAVDLAIDAERAGAYRVWLSEDLFYRGAVPTAGAIAQSTHSVGIGFGVLTPYNRHPSLLAMDLASLLELAGERVTFGLGAGVSVRVERMGLAHRAPLATVRDTIDMVGRLLRGERVTAIGEVHAADDLALDLGRRWSRVPVYVASTGPNSLRQTGEISDGLILTIMATSDHIRWATSLANQSAADADRPNPMPTAVYMPLHLGDDPAEALARAKRTVSRYLTRWATIPGLAKLFTEWGELDSDHLVAVVDRLSRGDDPTHLIPDRVASAHCVAGNTADCITALEELADAGADEVALDLGCATPGELLSGIEKLTEKRGAP